MRTALGPEEASRLCAALCTPPSLSVRLNADKPADLFGKAEPVPWCYDGRYLTERPEFTLMPELHAGAFYVQDASSMILTEVVRRLTSDGEPVHYLDACAAPGGKSTAALSVLPKGSLLVANEYVPLRAQILKENIQKWGTPGVIVTQGDTARLQRLRDTFDLVAVDAPCSGEGMMRKDEQAVAQWSPALVAQCAAMQREIMANVWNALRPGGYMIYSTCTFNSAENEDNVRHFIRTFGAEAVDLNLPPEWGIGASRDADLPALRFMPHLTRGEGLFLCVLRKPEAENKANGKCNNSKHRLEKGTNPRLNDWISNPDDYKILTQGEMLTAFPRHGLTLLRDVQKECKVIMAGTELATPKGRDLVPAHALALSRILRPDAFPRVEHTLAEARNYLRRLPISLPSDTPRGYVLATYRSLPLGFLKNIGNRANNLYPQPWRIRTK